MRTLIYARFSSTLQNPRSIEDQVALCRELCDREGWMVTGVFTDHAIGGAAGIDAAARPGLNALLERVEAANHPDGPVDQVLAEATDRIARHQGDALAIRERVIYAGARIFTLSDGEVTNITATFRGLMDAQFRVDLAAKVKRGQRGTLAQQRHPAGLAYGYRTANRLDERGQLIRGLRDIDPDQAAIVRRIFAEYAAGASPRAIAAGLNRGGLRAPGGRIGVTPYWRASTIYGDRQRRNGILQNRLYAGELVFNRTRKLVDPRTRKPRIIANPEAEWLVEQVPELRIVEDSLWQAVQAGLQRRRQVRPEHSRRPKHMLSGLASCGTCGGAWTIRGPNRWGCSRNKEGGPQACANGRTISTSLMEGRVLAGLRERMLDPALVDVYVREYHLAFARGARERSDAGEQLQRQHRELSARVDRLVAAVAAGGEEFTEILDALRTARGTRDQVAAQLEQLEQLPVIALHPTIAADYRAQVEQLNEALAANPAARTEVIPRLRALIDHIAITPTAEGRGVEIEVTGRLAAMLALATGNPSHPPIYGNDGAGEGIWSLPQLLRAVV